MADGIGDGVEFSVEVDTRAGVESSEVEGRII